MNDTTLARRTRAKPMPDEFRRIAATTSNEDLRARFGIGVSTLARWRQAIGVRAPHNCPWKEPMPASFPEIAPTMTRYVLADHYGVSTDVVKRWCDEAGVKYKPTHPLGRKGPRVSAADRAIGTVTVMNQRDHSRAGQAADFLRRFGPVVRCDAEGRYAERGTHYRRGSTVLTGEEVIERAVRNGWNPDAWREVA